MESLQRTDGGGEERAGGPMTYGKPASGTGNNVQ